jgi:hypothetical protein
MAAVCFCSWICFLWFFDNFCLKLLLFFVFESFWYINVKNKKYIFFMHFTIIIFRFTNIIFFGYLYSQSINTKLADVITNENNLLEELSSVSLSVIILQMDLLMDKVRQKKLHLLYVVGTFIVEYNISPTGKPYVIPSMIFLFYRWNRQTNCLLFHQ